MRYSVSKNIEYCTAREFLDTVVDVESYREFIPWCRAVRVIERFNEDVFTAEMVVSFKGMTEKYTSRIKQDVVNGEIEVEHIEGPFKYLRSRWNVQERGGVGEGCVVDFFIEFEFRSKLLQHLIGRHFLKASEKLMDAYQERVKELYTD